MTTETTEPQIPSALDRTRICTLANEWKNNPASEPLPAMDTLRLPLWRVAQELFREPEFSGLLASVCDPDPACAFPDAFYTTEAMARDWLKTGGKRLRAFVVLAAYAAAKHGVAGLALETDVSEIIPKSVRRLALAVEALHKASLIHDDIEDDDPFRYGQPTLHQRHGLAPAINTGDWLVGLGYRLAADAASHIGPEVAALILQKLTACHMALCQGQGAELHWTARAWPLTPADALTLYAMKTAPAFEAALYTGWCAGGGSMNLAGIKCFASCLGQAFQVQNDLNDWRATDANKKVSGRDAITRRPTLLYALARQAVSPDALHQAQSEAGQGRPEAMRRLYEQEGIFRLAEQGQSTLKARALAEADQAELPGMRDLMYVLGRLIVAD